VELRWSLITFSQEKVSSMATQLTFDDFAATQAPSGWASAREEQLLRQVEGFREVCRDLEAETARLRDDLCTLTTALKTAQLKGDYWKRAFQLQMAGRPSVTPETPVEPRLFKQLMAIIHPDHWHQGQPASALAHELTVALNALRAEGRIT
jgi:hypothetical protein